MSDYIEGHRKIKKTHGDRVHKPRKGKVTTTETEPSKPPKAKKHKVMDSDEDDEELQIEAGTSSNS